MADDDGVGWNVDLEVSLFHAMRRHKPIGVNKHFQMLCIYEKLNNSKKKISAVQIWKHLSEMYDLQALHESEILPFPNKPIDFTLPDGDYANLLSKDFPRLETTTPSTQTQAADDMTVKDTKEITAKIGRPSAVEKAAERLQDIVKNEESPRREQRKRTRGTTQSPATTTPESATSTKRARRI